MAKVEIRGKVDKVPIYLVGDEDNGDVWLAPRGDLESDDISLVESMDVMLQLFIQTATQAYMEWPYCYFVPFAKEWGVKILDKIPDFPPTPEGVKN